VPATGDHTPGPDDANDAEDAEEGEGPKVLSKKEKERLKKEKEKVNFYWILRDTDYKVLIHA
jgi:hypothetical protein